MEDVTTRTVPYTDKPGAVLTGGAPTHYPGDEVRAASAGTLQNYAVSHDASGLLPAKALQTIRQIRQLAFSEQDMIHAMTHGSCFRLAKLIRSIYPAAKLWNNQDHVIIEIAGRFMDITGELHVSAEAVVVDMGGAVPPQTRCVKILGHNQAFLPLPREEEKNFKHCKFEEI